MKAIIQILTYFSKATLWHVWERSAYSALLGKPEGESHLEDIGVWEGKGIGKVHLRIGHEGPEGKQRYGSTLSLTSALDGVSGQVHVPAALPPRKTRYPLYRKLGGPQSRVDGKTVLMQTFKKYDGLWAGLIWLRMETGGKQDVIKLRFPYIASNFLQIQSSSLGRCHSCNTYINPKTLRFSSQLCFPLQTRST